MISNIGKAAQLEGFGLSKFPYHLTKINRVSFYYPSFEGPNDRIRKQVETQPLDPLVFLLAVMESNSIKKQESHITPAS